MESIENRILTAKVEMAMSILLETYGTHDNLTVEVKDCVVVARYAYSFVDSNNGTHDSPSDGVEYKYEADVIIPKTNLDLWLWLENLYENTPELDNVKEG